MEEEISALLLASAGVTALCGQRIDLGENAQGAAYPRIAIWDVSRVDDYNIQGPSGHSRRRIQIDCYTLTYKQAKQVSRAVIDVLSGYSAGGLQGVFLVADQTTREGGVNVSERPYRSRLDYMIQFNPT